jgi:RNA polymerase sigma-70 factor (ECF subfamily)
VTAESINDSTQTALFLSQVCRGDSAALPHLLAHYRAYLAQLLELRMEDELRRRVDPSDVIQEAQIVVMRRIDDYLRRRPASFKIWLRGEVLQQLIKFRRQHLKAEKRSVYREVELSNVSSLAVARSLLSANPSAQFRKKEAAQRIRAVIDSLSAIDREILLLRRVEELTNEEVAELLQIESSTARKRYGRAIRRLSQKMQDEGLSSLFSS